MRGLISAGEGEMVRLKKVLLKKIDGVHTDVRTMEDIMRTNIYVREIGGVLA